MEFLLSTAISEGNPIAGDLLLVNGDFVWTEDRTLEILQRMRSRLRFFQGEWFLDLRQGIPYFQTIFQRADDRTLRAIFSQVLRRTPGVALLDVLQIVRDREAREVRITFQCRLDTNEIVSSVLTVEI